MNKRNTKYKIKPQALRSEIMKVQAIEKLNNQKDFCKFVDIGSSTLQNILNKGETTERNLRKFRVSGMKMSKILAVRDDFISLFGNE